MQKVVLGRTGLAVDKNGFGALPIQRITMDAAGRLLRKAFDGGINYFDTARMYSDSEEKIGASLSAVRERIVISTKTTAQNPDDFRRDLAASLARLRTGHIDIYQFHNPAFCPKPGDGSGLYEAMLEAKQHGKIRFIGFTNHRLAVAKEAVESGLYDTLQFPFSYLADASELELVKLCRSHNVGFIAMKALAGGLIADAALAYAYMAQFDHVEPIWGIQKESELDDFLACRDNPPEMTEARLAMIQNDRRALAAEFCRGCGYCLPCPAGIEINNCARMSLLLRRAPAGGYLTQEWREKMKKIENCIHCNRCRSKCPYGLDTPELLAKNYEDYKTFL